MDNLKAAWASCLVQLKLRFSPVRLGLNLIEGVPVTITYVWLALKAGNSDLLVYILVGTPIVTIWANISVQFGWMLDGEIWSQTILFVLTSRTPLLVAMLGRLLGELIIGIPFAILSCTIVVLFAHQIPPIADVGLFVPSVVITVIGLIATLLILSPFVVLVRGRSGFFAIIVLFGIVFGGFVYPVERLPDTLQIIARMLPTSWSMSSVWQSIGGVSSWTSVLPNWAISIAISLVFFTSSHWLFQNVEKQIRISGTLGAS
jgi:ABC-type multidrug transport system permease subunit